MMNSRIIVYSLAIVFLKALQTAAFTHTYARPRHYTLRSAGRSADTDFRKKLFIFGLGYVGTEVALALSRDSRFEVRGTCTNIKKIESMQALGIKAYLFDADIGPMFQKEAVDELLSSTHVLCTIPPTDEGDAVIAKHGMELRKMSIDNTNLEWVGYLSSTGVYGERDGAWVTEDDEALPNNKKTRTRFATERAWAEIMEKIGLPLHVFRLAGIYGPGRSALDTLSNASGDMSQCGPNDVTLISRIHVEDICSVLKASMLSPTPGRLINVADDLPSTRYEVLSFACRLLNFPIGKPENDLGPEKSGIRGGSKRIDNTRMRALLLQNGLDIKYSDYRSGLQSIFYGDFASDASEDESEAAVAIKEALIEDDEGSSVVAPKTVVRRGGLADKAKGTTDDSGKIALLEKTMSELVESNRDLKDIVSKLVTRMP